MQKDVNAMFNRDQEAARRRKQMSAKKEKVNAGMDAVRGRDSRMPADSRSGSDRDRVVLEIPSPRQGGTFYYCIEPMASVRRKGGIVNIECSEVTNTPKHFRTAVEYRRHWRLFHG